MDMSNKSLALLLVAAIVISLGGTMIVLNQISDYRITGLATSMGNVTLEVSSSAACRVTSNVSFGAASAPTQQINISTMIDNSGEGFNDCTSNSACYGMQVNNTGNVDLNISLTSDANATDLLGYTVNDTMWFTHACINGTAATGVSDGCITGLDTVWAEVNKTEHLICNNLTWDPGYEAFTIEYNVTLNASVPPGLKQANITIDCEQLP